VQFYPATHCFYNKTIPAMPATPTNLIQMVAYYNELLTRFAMRFNGGNESLAEKLVKDALEAAWEENKFYEGRPLRLLLKNKIIAGIRSQQSSVY
jgi:DNA-directed RNA polymerase specialized sigma24 family protein